MTSVRQVRFCTGLDGARVAYAVVGRGPALVVAAGWLGHLELTWQDPAYRGFASALAAHRTLVHYDPPGSGLSAPLPGGRSLDSDLGTLHAVLDALALPRVTLVGFSTGAPVAIAYAADHPDRVDRLVLYGGYADGTRIATAEVRAALLGLIRVHWGLGSDLLAEIFLPDADPAEREQFARLQRGAAPAGVAEEMLRHCYDVDVTDRLGGVRCPTLVVHRRGDRAIPYRLGVELAAAIPGARLVSLDGRSHFPYIGDSGQVAAAILEFLGAPAAHRAAGPLTARQLEIAALVAQGLTNREIAARTGIQERSAEGHVERIRLRLGFSSRSQIAAWWARRDG